MMDTHGLAWAAGLFDGEGTVFATQFVKRGRDSRRLHVAVTMTDFHSIRRFAAAVQVGAIDGPYEAGPGQWKPQLRWRTSRFEHGQFVVALLWRWLGPAKRAQAVKALESALWHHRNPRNYSPVCLKKAFCKRGHDLSVTRYTAPGGGSYCRVCQAERRRAS